MKPAPKLHRGISAPCISCSVYSTPVLVVCTDQGAPIFYCEACAPSASVSACPASSLSDFAGAQ